MRKQRKSMKISTYKRSVMKKAKKEERQVFSALASIGIKTSEDQSRFSSLHFSYI